MALAETPWADVLCIEPAADDSGNVIASPCGTMYTDGRDQAFWKALAVSGSERTPCLACFLWRRRGLRRRPERAVIAALEIVAGVVILVCVFVIHGADMAREASRHDPRRPKP